MSSRPSMNSFCSCRYILETAHAHALIFKAAKFNVVGIATLRHDVIAKPELDVMTANATRTRQMC